jgi:hypothetical protein
MTFCALVESIQVSLEVVARSRVCHAENEVLSSSIGGSLTRQLRSRKGREMARQTGRNALISGEGDSEGSTSRGRVISERPLLVIACIEGVCSVTRTAGGAAFTYIVVEAGLSYQPREEPILRVSVGWIRGVVCNSRDAAQR